MQVWIFSDVAATILIAGLIFFVVMRPPVGPLRLPVLGLLSCALLWVVGDLITLLAPNIETDELGLAVVYSGSIPINVMNWLVAIRYADAEGRPFGLSNNLAVRAPLVYAAVAWSLMITNPLHGWFLTPVLGGRNEFHALWWVVFAVGYTLTFSAMIAFARLYASGRTRREKINAGAMFTAFIVPLAINLAYVSWPSRPPVDPTVGGVFLSCAIMLGAIYRTDLFFLQPITLGALLRGDPAGIMLIDRHGLIRYSTPAARELLGEHDTDGDAVALISDRTSEKPESAEPSAREWLSERLVSESPDPHRAVFRLARGGERWIQLDATPVFSSRGEPLAVSLRMEDVTEARLAEAERQLFETRALQAQKLESLGLLAGGIAHDFNNLLTGILGNAELALEALDRSDPTRPLILDVEAAAVKAARLVNQMLDYAGASSPVKKPADLSAEVEGIANLLESSLSTKAVLERRFDQGAQLIEADVARIHKVVMNLIINASDALGDEAGTITVATGRRTMTREELNQLTLGEDRAPGVYSYFEVSDDGAGMDAAERSRIFDPFFTTKFAGRGLGMAGVLGIVNAHEGAIDVETELGVGTRIRVLFPASPSAELDPDEPTADGQQGAAGVRADRKTVLVVDDDELVGATVKRFLEASGFRVLLARNGPEALTMFETRGDEVSAVLLDLTMPVLGGEEVLAQLRRLRPGIGVALMSGYAEDRAWERFEGVRPDVFLKKPFAPGEIVRAIESLLGEDRNDRGAPG